MTYGSIFLRRCKSLLGDHSMENLPHRCTFKRSYEPGVMQALAQSDAKPYCFISLLRTLCNFVMLLSLIQITSHSKLSNSSQIKRRNNNALQKRRGISMRSVERKKMVARRTSKNYSRVFLDDRIEGSNSACFLFF